MTRLRGYPVVCKGTAMGLETTVEFAEGNIAGFCEELYENPYDFWDNYTEHYAWDIGYQQGRRQA